MRSFAAGAAFVLLASCSCNKSPATAPGPTDHTKPYAPRPPPTSSPGRWDPEPPAVTAALALRPTDPGHAHELLLAAAAEATRSGDERARAIALHRAGDLALDLGRCEEAEARYLEALALHQARKDLKLVAVAANDLGLHGSSCQKDPITWFELSVRTREELGDPEALRVGLSNLGGAAMLWRPPVEARPILERALKVAEQVGDVEGRRRTHVNLAATLMYLALEETARDAGVETSKLAFAQLEAALALGTQQGFGPGEAGCHGLPMDLWWMCGPKGLDVLGEGEAPDLRDDPEFDKALEEEAMAEFADVRLAVGEKSRLEARGVTKVEVSPEGIVEAKLTPRRAVLLKGLARGDADVVLFFGTRTEEKSVSVR